MYDILIFRMFNPPDNLGFYRKTIREALVFETESDADGHQKRPLRKWVSR
jgi:hypothetical protein